MTQDEALAIWEYRDGHLYWRENRGKRTKAGDRAGSTTTRPTQQYRHIQFDRKLYQEHRLIFLMHRGYLPDEIDHIDRNGLNNDIENLRAATRSQNGCNRGAPKNNTSGFKGVSYSKGRQLYEAEIRVGGKRYRLGRFPSARQAHEAYKAAATKLHNEFARFA